MTHPCAILVLVLVGALAPHTQAGVYNPAEKCPFPIRPDGVAEELSFGSQVDGTFPQVYLMLLNIADANPARAGINPDRQAVLERIAKRIASPDLSSPDLAGLAADWLRVGKPDDALNLLAPRSRDRVPDFRILANLAHVYATRGEWNDALRWHQAAFLDTEFPTDLAGATEPQRTWLKGVDRTHYRRWLQVHRDRAVAKERPESEGIFPLFPMQFVNERGEYEVGQLAASERAKLPADAIPIVQQLLLWSPWDTGLYWLLAELYAANGRLREAAYIFDRCADTRQYSNRRIFMAHRSAIRDAVAKLPPETPEVEVPLTSAELPKPAPDSDAFLPSTTRIIAVGIAFVVIVVVFGGLQVRAIARRR